MTLIDLTHTSHCPGHTGIQRVCRSLYSELENTHPFTPVCFDPYQNAWRRLHADEKENLYPPNERNVITSRKSRWTTAQRVNGHLRRIVPFHDPYRITKGEIYDGLLVPEIFGPKYPRASRKLRPHVKGPRAALFYDAIAVKFPEHSPSKTIRRFPGYLMNLLDFDGIAAISEASREDLLAYWKEAGVSSHPPVVTIPVGTDLESCPVERDHSKKVEEPPIVLMVATIESRKNHLNLLKGAERLWKIGVRFQLRLVGASNPETAGEAIRLIDKAEREGKPVTWLGHVSEDELIEEYQKCTFSIYPSFYEGFGLPVLESLRYGKPAICTDRGALKEAACGGGCWVLQATDAGAIADGIRRLIEDNSLRQKLTAEAQERRFKTWKVYTGEIIEWMRNL